MSAGEPPINSPEIRRLAAVRNPNPEMEKA
jgi:hypothetical protein